jgi:acyl-CoA reductase-like NAD-dependent aldehyde dehydrogenase
MICRRAKELRFGPVLAPPVDGYISAADCGSMISSERFGNIKRILDKAERDGAVVDVGAKEYIHPYFKSGSYFSATVVGNPLPDSAVAQLECKRLDSVISTCLTYLWIVFAPVAVIQCYETAKEAIELANGTRYGLGASVFGPDQSSCIHIAKQLQCGMVSINDFGVFYVSTNSMLIHRFSRSFRSSRLHQLRIQVVTYVHS